jgi:LETM1 and EF-hand domain-containing protein 1
MAKFLQETIRESGIKSPDKIKQSEEFKEFFRKVRSFLFFPLLFLLSS